MAKLYYSDEIGEEIDKKLERKAREIIMDSQLDGEELLNAVHDFRTMKKHLYSFMDDLKDVDAAYDAKMAVYSTKQEETDGTAT